MRQGRDLRFLGRFAGLAGYALGLRVLWALISFAGAALLARWFTREEYGTYASIISLITFLSVVCALGAPNAIVRMLAEFGGDHPNGENAALAHGLLRATQLGTLGASIGVAVLLAAGAAVLGQMHQTTQAAAYVAGAALLPAFTLCDVQAAAARSYGSVFIALAPRDVIWRLLLIPLGWTAAMFLHPTSRLTGLMVSAAAALTVLAYLQALGIRGVVPAVVREAPARYDFQKLRRISASTWVTQVASAVFRSLDVVVAGFLLPPREVGLYYAASRVAALISFVLVSTNVIVGPEVAKLHHSARQARLIRTLKLASLIVFLPSLFAFLACVVFPDLVLGLFGHGFREARPQLIILAVGQLMNAATGCVGIVLMMTGLERKNAEVLVTTSVATVVAMVVLTRLFGSIGTAIATAAGLGLWNMRLWLVARRHTPYDPSVFGILRPSGA